MSRIHIPETHYVGINLERNSKDEVPLGFLTPGGTDSAAKKRQSTVDQWCGKNGSSYEYVSHDEAEQFQKDNPDAKQNERFGIDRPQAQFIVPKKEGRHYLPLVRRFRSAGLCVYCRQRKAECKRSSKGQAALFQKHSLCRL